ncbi:MAG: thiamine-phosphate kinase [Gemmatimonadota bacterium]
MTPVPEPRLGPGGEFDRIRSMARVLGSRAAGLGDDCALVDMGGEVLAASVDLSVERIHFRRDWLSFHEIGWRSVAGALSDLAAMGATPIGVLTAIGVPDTSAPADLDQLMAGIGSLLEETGGVVLGGDLSTSPVWTVSVTVLGRARRPVLRSGGRPGDSVWVTGTLGGSRAALETWLAGGEPAAASRERFASPFPRLLAGVWLADQGAGAMIDLSDGLAGDVRHLAAASGAAIAIDLSLLPVHQGVAPVAHRAGEDPRVFAAAGGEDYELLAVLPPEFTETMAQRLEAHAGVGLTRVGSVEAGAGARLLLDGKPVAIAGYDHFR